MQKSHEEPVTILEADWLGLVDQFESKLGERVHDTSRPLPVLLRKFQVKIMDGHLYTGTLTHVVSLFEEDRQKAQKPEPSRQLGLNIDATLTIQTRRQYVSTLSTGNEELRGKYRVMSNMWFLAQFRQPGRAPYSNLNKETWAEFIEKLFLHAISDLNGWSTVPR